jgi:hypothetical protein
VNTYDQVIKKGEVFHVSEADVADR